MGMFIASSILFDGCGIAYRRGVVVARSDGKGYLRASKSGAGNWQSLHAFFYILGEEIDLIISITIWRRSV